MFRAIVTILAGRWNARPLTRWMNHLFFAVVALQKRFALTKRRFKRDETAGYPTGDAA